MIITSDKCYENIEQSRGYHENDLLGGKDPYSASKGAAELVFRSYYNSFFKNQDKIRIATVRAGNVIGGGDWAKNRLVPDCIRAWGKNKIVSIRNPNSTRPWQHVLEPLSGYLHLASHLFDSKELNGESFNFGPPIKQNYKVIDLIKKIEKYFFNNLENRYSIDYSNLFYESNLLKLDCKKAKKILSWSATLNFDQTAELTAIWYSDYNIKNIEALTKSQIYKYHEYASILGQLWA